MKCPCEECISFAICKIKALETNDVTHLSVKQKCHTLQEYIHYSTKELQFSMRTKSKINVARKLFGLKVI